MESKIANFDYENSIKYITESCMANGNNDIERWWGLATEIVAKYSDGYINLPDRKYATPEINPTRNVGYPSLWLFKTNYKEGPTSYRMK